MGGDLFDRREDWMLVGDASKVGSPKRGGFGQSSGSGPQLDLDYRSQIDVARRAPSIATNALRPDLSPSLGMSDGEASTKGCDDHWAVAEARLLESGDGSGSSQTVSGKPATAMLGECSPPRDKFRG